MSGGIKIITKNRKAGFNYELMDTFRAGLVLQGAEIKSIRANRVTLQDSFVEERNGELWLLNVHISPYEQAGTYGAFEPTRPRKLLLHKKEIAEIISRIRERGLSAIPTMIFLERGRAKVEIAVARGKKDHDKRDAIAKRDADRQIRQALKGNY